MFVNTFFTCQLHCLASRVGREEGICKMIIKNNKIHLRRFRVLFIHKTLGWDETQVIAYEYNEMIF